MSEQPRVLVVGGTGLIGSRVAKVFAAARWSVTVCGRLGCWCLDAPSLPEPYDVRLLIAQQGWDAVVDFRAMTPADVEWLAFRPPEDVGAWCHISTMYVYGNPRRVMAGSDAFAEISEDMPPRPFGAYGVNKLLTELALRRVFASGRTRLTICRLPYVFGSGDRTGRTERLLASIRSPGFRMPANGGHQVDLLHASAAADLICGLIRHPLSDGVYNVSEPPAQRFGTHLRALGRAAGVELRERDGAFPEALPFSLRAPFYLSTTKLSALAVGDSEARDLQGEWSEAISSSNSASTL